MTLEIFITICIAIGSLVSGVGIIVGKFNSILSNREKEFELKINEFTKINNECSKEIIKKIELMEKDAQTFQMELQNHKRDNDNVFNKFKQDFLVEKEKIITERNKIIEDVKDDLNEVETNVGLLEIKLNNIIETLKDNGKKFDDLYSKINELTKFIIGKS